VHVGGVDAESFFREGVDGQRPRQDRLREDRLASSHRLRSLLRRDHRVPPADRPFSLWSITSKDNGNPGWIRVPKHKAFVYTHGKHREPIKGVSDLDVAYTAYESKQKLKFLRAQSLEGQSLPKIVAYGRDHSDAQNNAELHAQARASGVIPQVANADLPKGFDVVESSGRGAAQFVGAIRYLEQEQTNSVLAGFTDLTQIPSGHGSYALSADQSEFFLASRQATADEIAEAITDDVIRPLVILNFGAEASVPTLHIGPIGNSQTGRALEILKTLLVAQTVNAPQNFVDQLITSTSTYLGLDAHDVAEAIKPWREQQRTQREMLWKAQQE